MKQMFELPLRIKAARAWRTYQGGMLLDRRAGKQDAVDTNFPEEWMFSTVRAANAGREAIVEGLCTLTDYPELTLKRCIEMYPNEMLGKQHAVVWGSQLGVLMKQIDSAERLTIQVHPNNEMAQRLFGSSFGKTECWHILSVRDDTPEPPCLYLGFREGITRAAWEACFHAQNYEGMLSMLHRFPVKPGETYLVCGGVPHAIGAGCMLVEIQEPTDYTIRVETVTPSGQKIAPMQCHQGLGFETMFDCFLYEGLSFAQTKRRWCLPPRAEQNACTLVGYDDTPCFKMQKIEVSQPMLFSAESVYYCLYVLSGEAALTTDAQTVCLSQNTELFISAACRDFSISPQNGQSVTLLKIHGPQV